MRSRRPWGLAGMLALIWVVEGALGRCGTHRSDHVALAWRCAADDASGPAVRADVLCLGDSLVKAGVLPRVIEGISGRRACSLSVFAGQAPSSFFLLRRALEAGARPSAVLVNFHPNLLAASPRMNAGYWPDLLDARDGLDLAWNSLDPRLIVDAMLARLANSVRDRREIRRHVFLTLADLHDALHVDGRVLERNWRSNAGAHVAADRPSMPFAEPPERRSRWSPNPVNVRYIRRLLDLAASRGIEVYCLVPPTSPAWQARRERLGADAAFERFLRGLVSDHSNLVVIDGRHSGYDAPVFGDATHLNRRGAAALSVELAGILGGGRGGDASSRWRPLPPFIAADPSALPIEDLDQSRLALESADGRAINRPGRRAVR